MSGNGKDDGQEWREVWPTDSHEWYISEVTNGNSVFPVLQDYAEDLVNFLNALQQRVTELEAERDMLAAVVDFAVLQPSAAHSICVSGQNDYRAMRDGKG